jgi:Mg-chelatase subunit ChlD
MIKFAQVLYREDRPDPENATLMVVTDGRVHEFDVTEAQAFSLLESIAVALKKMRAASRVSDHQS